MGRIWVRNTGGCTGRGDCGRRAGTTSRRLKPDAPGLAHNHRLILKDGSYQVVREYQVVGDRVRYMSMERGGDWEELPYDLVDWDATKKWEEHHTGPYDTSGGSSEAMKEAAELDKEEAAERDDQKARMPEVAKGPGASGPRRGIRSRHVSGNAGTWWS